MLVAAFIFALPLTHSLFLKKIIIDEIKAETHDADLEDAYINVYASYMSMEKIRINKPGIYSLSIDKIASTYDFDFETGYKLIEEINVDGGKLVLNAIKHQNHYPDLKTMVRSMELKDFAIEFKEVFPQAESIGGGLLIKHAYFPPEMKIAGLLKKLKLNIRGFDEKLAIDYDETSEQIKISHLPLAMCPYINEFGLQHFTSGYLDVNLSYKAEGESVLAFEITPHDLSVTIPENASFTETMILKSLLGSAKMLDGKPIPFLIPVNQADVETFIYDLKYLNIKNVSDKLKAVK